MNKNINMWILSYHRTGSTYLGGLLSQYLQGRERLRERLHFRNKKEKFREEFDKSPTIFRFVKVLRNHFDHKFEDADKSYIEKKLPGLKYILLKRKNVLEVTISLYFAKKTRSWEIKNESSKKSCEQANIKYDESLILQCYNECKNLYTCWDNYLKDSQYLPIDYSELLENPSRCLKTCLEYLDVECIIDDKIEEAIKKCPFKKAVRKDSQKYMEKLKELVRKLD